MSRPLLLDLFCGPGGAAVGYHRAGFDIVGVDITEQPLHPFTFVKGDAIKTVESLLHCHMRDYSLRDFAAIHASPPCPRWSRMQRQRKNAEAHPDLITQLRPLLERTGLPYVIENVQGAPLHESVLLCGSMFDMDIRWHRLFETNWGLPDHPWPCRHKIHAPHRFPGTPNGSGKRPGNAIVNPMASDVTHDMFAKAKGIDWIPSNGRKRPSPELNDAIPPMFTEYIGGHLMTLIGAPC